MSVVSIPIVNRNYQMGCEDGQEGRLIELGRYVDARARQILDK
nr:cell division protein ZapA [Candidatus Enterousia merdequi]